ncbi:MAG: hypothetical protein ACLQU4_07360 [Limisphaerales bacterium]
MQDAANTADVANKHAEQSIKNAEAQLEADQKLNVEGRERIEILEQQLALMQQVNAQTQAAATRAAGSRIATENIESVQRAYAAGEEALQHLNNGRGFSQADLEKLIELVHRLAQLHTSKQDVGSALSRKVTALEGQIQELERDHGYLEQRLSSGAYIP